MIIVPLLVTETAQAIMNSPKYFGKFTLQRSETHICICGIVDYELLHRFSNEILTSFIDENLDQDAINGRLMLVVMSPNMPSDNVLLLMNTPFYRRRIKYFIGSCKSFLDLRRVLAHKAKAVYVVADIATSSIKVEEDSIYLSAISISRYLQSKKNKINSTNTLADPNFIIANSTKTKTIVKLSSSARNRSVLHLCGVSRVISVQEIKYTVIAVGPICPGFLGLFHLLNISSFPLCKISHQKLLQNSKKIYEVAVNSDNIHALLGNF